MRYIVVPNPFKILDPVEEQPVAGAEEFSFAKFVRVLTSNAAADQSADTLTLADIRASVATLSAGATWIVEDEWYEILKKQATRIKGAQPAFVFSAVPHVRAIMGATDKPSAAAS